MLHLNNLKQGFIRGLNRLCLGHAFFLLVSTDQKKSLDRMQSLSSMDGVLPINGTFKWNGMAVVVNSSGVLVY